MSKNKFIKSTRNKNNLKPKSSSLEILKLLFKNKDLYLSYIIMLVLLFTTIGTLFLIFSYNKNEVTQEYIYSQFLYISDVNKDDNSDTTIEDYNTISTELDILDFSLLYDNVDNNIESKSSTFDFDSIIVKENFAEDYSLLFLQQCGENGNEVCGEQGTDTYDIIITDAIADHYIKEINENPGQFDLPLENAYDIIGRTVLIEVNGSAIPLKITGILYTEYQTLNEQVEYYNATLKEKMNYYYMEKNYYRNIIVNPSFQTDVLDNTETPSVLSDILFEYPGNENESKILLEYMDESEIYNLGSPFSANLEDYDSQIQKAKIIFSIICFTLIIICFTLSVKITKTLIKDNLNEIKQYYSKRRICLIYIKSSLIMIFTYIVSIIVLSIFVFVFNDLLFNKPKHYPMNIILMDMKSLLWISIISITIYFLPLLYIINLKDFKTIKE